MGPKQAKIGVTTEGAGSDGGSRGKSDTASPNMEEGAKKTPKGESQLSVLRWFWAFTSIGGLVIVIF